MACKENQVPFAHHVFSKGRHGLSLANEDWAAGNIGDPNTIEQLTALIQAAKDGVFQAPEELMKSPLFQIDSANEKQPIPLGEPMPEVAIWPILADCWIKGLS